MVFFSYKIKKMIAFKWMGERKQEPPWGGIKQLNFPLLSASPTTSLSGKGHRTLQQNLSQTRCTTALGHDMLPQPPQRAHDLWPDRSQAWVCRWQARTNEDREHIERSARYNSGPNETAHRWGWLGVEQRYTGSRYWTSSCWRQPTMNRHHSIAAYARLSLAVGVLHRLVHLIL